MSVAIWYGIVRSSSELATSGHITRIEEVLIWILGVHGQCAPPWQASMREQSRNSPIVEEGL